MILLNAATQNSPRFSMVLSYPNEVCENLRLHKNDILKKLRIAMSFREQEMLATLEQGGTSMSKSELGALFRNPGHKHFRGCGNQVLRNFIKGLTLQLRADTRA